MSKFFFIGDSITAGAWDEKGGWANRLIGQIMERTIAANFEDGAFYCLPYNLGVSGNTAEDVLKRLEKEVIDRVNGDEDPNEFIEFVIAIGTNDSIFMVNENRPRFTDDDFRQNILDLIKLSRKVAHHVSFIGLTPVEDMLLNPMPWAPDMAYACEHVKRFEDIIGQVCAAQNIPFLPLFDRWLAKPDWKEHLIDGIHPNTRGHELLAQQIGAFLFTKEFVKLHRNG